MLAIGRRRYQGLGEIRSLGAAADAKVANLWNLTTGEARAYMAAELNKRISAR